MHPKARQLNKQQAIPYNPFFLLPFLVWVVTGGILLLSFSKKQLFSFINLHHSPIADTLMYYATYMGQVEVIIPGLILVGLIPKNRNWWYFITATLCNIVPLLVQQVFKYYFDIIRPVNYFHGAKWIHMLPDWPVILTRSFPSGHSQGAFSFFCFLSLLLSEKNKAAGLLFFALAITTCYSRVYLAAHFVADIYAGSIIGMVTTSLIFAVMIKYRHIFKKGTFA